MNRYICSGFISIIFAALGIMKGAEQCYNQHYPFYNSTYKNITTWNILLKLYMIKYTVIYGIIPLPIVYFAYPVVKMLLNIK